MKLRKASKTVGAVTLIVAFGLFNIGLPVVMYLCPMMSGENPVCEMSDSPSAGVPSIARQASDCCGKYLVAERNTAPFVKSHQVDQEKIAVSASLTEELRQNFFSVQHSTSVDSPHPHTLPLFLLNSTLLI